MYYTVIKHSGHLRTLEKCRKHSLAARVFSNDHRVLSECDTRLRLLYLLNIITKQITTHKAFVKVEIFNMTRAWDKEKSESST